jgi:PAS domain S-box-containing protein
MNALKRILTPPVFEDELKTEQAYLLHVILWTLVCVPIPYLLFIFAKSTQYQTRALIQAGFGEAINILLLAILRRGHVRLASILQVSAFWLFFTLTAVTGNGVQGEAYLLGYGLVIAVAGILLGARGALIFTFLSLTSGWLMIHQPVSTWISPGFKGSPLTTWTISLVLFPVGAVIQYLGARVVKTFLQRARASEEKYRLISQVTSDYTFSTELDHHGNMHLNWVAGAFEIITGYGYEEYVANGGWRGHLFPGDVGEDKRAMDMLRSNHKAISEVRTYHRNGQLRWARVYAHPVWDAVQNRLTGIMGAVQDTTEQKQAEEALRKSEEIYRQAIEVAGAVPYHQTYDANNKVTYDFIGDGIQEITGYSAAEFSEPLWDSLVKKDRFWTISHHTLWMMPFSL